MDTLTLDNIPEAQWGAFMHALAGAGWTLTKGGGLDHSWATLTNAAGSQIDMVYDIWMQGEITITSADLDEVSAALPVDLRKLLGGDVAGADPIDVR
ncbi:hypothetical protein FXN63_12345 [Pigmentiphaga aceris]|uniref:Uncharacterized protein n=1 Tax=Pigmentiphaga aceris TaxID=1940612 RepID=A0A5C0AYQ1_9BURK|nr:hypothetical protein [Pigmentiphaga aceris]QEI06533.1 hypothetical protein FXN63_12345 [Pigmentiphaga aceris]